MTLHYQTLLTRGCGRNKQQGCKGGREGAIQLKTKELHGKVYSQWSSEISVCSIENVLCIVKNSLCIHFGSAINKISSIKIVFNT